MARTATLSVSSPSTTASSSSNRAGYSPSNVAAAQSSPPSVAGSPSATDASSMATTATLALTAAPASPNPGPTPTLALTAPRPASNNRMARRATSRDAGVGSSTQPPATGLERTVRIPLSINTNSAVLQQQLLNNRRGIPPKLSHFTRLLDRNTTHMLFRFANKYRPETRKDNRRRRKAKKAAATSVAVNSTDENAFNALDKDKKGKVEALDPVAAYDQQARNKTPYFLKHGMNHIAALAEKQMAQLVVISDDIEPPEVLVWLPALCRKNDVPCAIVPGSAQLGTLVNKRSATAMAFTKVREEEQVEFLRLVDLVTACYAHTNQQPARRAWMGGLRGFKNRVKVALRTAVAANRLQYQQQQQQQEQQQQGPPQ